MERCTENIFYIYCVNKESWKKSRLPKVYSKG